MLRDCLGKVIESLLLRYSGNLMLVLAEHLVVSIMTSYSLACWNYRTQKGISSKESSKNLISCYFYLLLQS